jgi:hypothetical protein
MTSPTRIATVVFASLLSVGCSQSPATVPAAGDSGVRHASVRKVPSQEELTEMLAAEVDRKPEFVVPAPELPILDIEGWTHGEFQQIPGLGEGHSIDYVFDDHITATIYVYDRGLTAISADVKSSEAIGDFENAKSQIQELVDLGFYTAAVENKSGIVKLGSEPFAPEALFHFLLSSALTLRFLPGSI